MGEASLKNSPSREVLAGDALLSGSGQKNGLLLAELSGGTKGGDASVKDLYIKRRGEGTAGKSVDACGVSSGEGCSSEVVVVDKVEGDEVVKKASFGEDDYGKENVDPDVVVLE